MAATPSLASIKRHFRTLKDPRVTKRSRHLLTDIVVIAICAVIADCDDWREIALFGQKREAWFRRFLRLPEGVPSHDTFARVFAKIDPQVFSRCCVSWLKAVSSLLGMGHIAIDGKTLRGSGGQGVRPLHLVSAWATQANLTLGEVAVDGKSNEIKAIPALLELLELHGALVTIDAMGCQKEICRHVVEKGGDYVLAVKANQQRLLEDIQKTVGKALDGALPKHQVATITTADQGHGRRERRSYTVVSNDSGIRDRAAWKGLKVVGICVRERVVKGEETTEAHYFIGSRRMAARRYAEALRGHWRVENNLHWQLDVSFSEDKSRVQQPNAAKNLATIRKLALCQLKRNSAPMSIARKRKAAALDLDFLAAVLTEDSKAEKV